MCSGFSALTMDIDDWVRALDRVVSERTRRASAAKLSQALAVAARTPSAFGKTQLARGLDLRKPKAFSIGFNAGLFGRRCKSVTFAGMTMVRAGANRHHRGLLPRACRSRGRRGIGKVTGHLLGVGPVADMADGNRPKPGPAFLAGLRGPRSGTRTRHHRAARLWAMRPGRRPGSPLETPPAAPRPPSDESAGVSEGENQAHAEACGPLRGHGWSRTVPGCQRATGRRVRSDRDSAQRPHTSEHPHPDPASSGADGHCVARPRGPSRRPHRSEAPGPGPAAASSHPPEPRPPDRARQAPLRLPAGNGPAAGPSICQPADATLPSCDRTGQSVSVRTLHTSWMCLFSPRHHTAAQARVDRRHDLLAHAKTRLHESRLTWNVIMIRIHCPLRPSCRASR